MKVVILCGGKGNRYQNQFNEHPKALAPIGNVPILWHLFKYFSFYGFNEFILCTGYKGLEIQHYIQTLELKQWKVQCIDTGNDSQTGERIRQIVPHTNNKPFLVTYADALSNIPIDKLVDFHKNRNQVSTISVVKPIMQYGVAHINENSIVEFFEEKPELNFYVNGGFMVFNPEIKDFIEEGDVLEIDTFNRLISQKMLSAFKHKGFWKGMDTFKENLELDEMWNKDIAPWRIW